MEQHLDINNVYASRKYFLLSILSLVPFGIVMVFSASYMFAKESFGSSEYFLWKQLTFTFLGAFVCLVVSKSKFSFWVKYAEKLHIIALVLILFTFFPYLGVKVKGASRWLNLGFVTIQPGEICKFTTVLLASKLFLFHKKWSKEKIIINIGLLLATLGLIIMQPDFGTFAILFLIISMACFLSDFPRKYLYGMVFSGIVTCAGLIAAEPYRLRRVFAYLDPWKNAQTSGFQLVQSYLAFANGKFLGAGLGNSNEKLFYLPEAHNDFIFSVIGEELGFLGVVFTVALFVFIVSMGLRLAQKMKKVEASMIITLIVFMIGVQALLNMSVVLGLLPTKGLNLPFISSGGSSMVVNFLGLGLIFSAINDHIKLERQI